MTFRTRNAVEIRNRRGLRLSAIGALLLVVTVTTGTGSAARATALKAPAALEVFQLRLGDGAGRTFPATPAFAWAPVQSAARYQFELSTNENFGSANGVVWSNGSLTSPTASVPIALPWMTNRPLYWRVRAFGTGSVSSWSKAASFRITAADAPRKRVSGPGFIRWSAVSDASAYQVWFVNLHKRVATTTTLADLRDYYGNGAPKDALWRVRAERRLYGSDKRALPATSYGRWSPTYTTPVDLNAAAPLRTQSNGSATNAATRA